MATMGVVSSLTLLLAWAPTGGASSEGVYLQEALRRTSHRWTGPLLRPFESGQPAQPSAASNDPLEQYAEELVRRGVLEGQLQQSRTEAVQRLQQAVSVQSPYVPLWIETCGRLKATEAAELVEGVLAKGEPGDALSAAIDAARMVVQPAAQPEQAQRVAERLELLADRLLQQAPFIAARALMGATLLAGPAFWPRLPPRFSLWPATHLEPTLRAVRRQLGTVRYAERRALPAVAELRKEALGLEERLRAERSMDASYTRADLLELLGLLAPLAPLEETLNLLHDIYTRNEPVVRSGAIAAVRKLCLEQPEAFRPLATATQGPRLLRAAMALREPTERKP